MGRRKKSKFEKNNAGNRNNRRNTASDKFNFDKASGGPNRYVVGEAGRKTIENRVAENYNPNRVSLGTRRKDLDKSDKPVDFNFAREWDEDEAGDFEESGCDPDGERMPDSWRHEVEPLYVHPIVPRNEQIFYCPREDFITHIFGCLARIVEIVSEAELAQADERPLVLIHKVPIGSSAKMVEDEIRTCGEIQVVHLFALPRYPFMTALARFVDPWRHLYICYLKPGQNFDLRFAYKPGPERNPRTRPIVESAYSEKLHAKLKVRSSRTGFHRPTITQQTLRFFHHNFGPISLMDSFLCFGNENSLGVLSLTDESLLDAALGWGEFYVYSDIDASIAPQPASRDGMDWLPSKMMAISGWKLTDLGIQELKKVLHRTDDLVIIEEVGCGELNRSEDSQSDPSPLHSKQHPDPLIYQAIATFSSEFRIDYFLSKRKMLQLDGGVVLFKKLSLPPPVPDDPMEWVPYFKLAKHGKPFYCQLRS